MIQWVKDLMLLLLWHKVDSWHGNFCVLWVWPKTYLAGLPWGLNVEH